MDGMLRIPRRLFTLIFLFALATASRGGETEAARSGPAIAPRISSFLPAELPSRLPPPITVGRPRPAVPIALPQMVRASGAIFAGTVIAIQRSPVSAKDAVPTIAVTFHVNHGIQGAVTGQNFTIRQWIGLWNSGRQRYRVGERALLFLYPASKLGLTSWVAGSLGRFPLDGLGRVVLSPEHISLLRSDPVSAGKPSLSIADFALAVGRAGTGRAVEEEGIAVQP
jgi:hypothetical protein